MNDAVLLVDDEPGIRKVIRLALTDMGYPVFTAGNGKEALSILERESPSIILTDIKMPDMDGISLLENIKAKKPDAEVILFTGYGDMDLAISGLKHDAADFITKPISVELLDIAIKKAREKILLRLRLREYTEHLEEMVKEKADQLAVSEKLAAVGQIVSNLAHTIKNITGGLRGGIYILEKGMERDDGTMLEQGFQMVKGNVEKITELSMDLLNYGKYMSLSPRKIDPNQPAREVTDLLEEKARMNRIIFFTDYCHHLKSMNIDPDAIHCCLLNLVGNALDACMAVDTPKQREIRLTVRAWTGRGVIYTVTDTGCGMDEEARNRIFNGFFTTKGSHGTGIGLMMTRNILEKHGGEIEWVSEKGTGSTFVVRFKEIHE